MINLLKMRIEKFIKFTYSCICKIYQILTTFFENIFYRVKDPEKDIKKLGFFKYVNNSLDFSYLLEFKASKVNEYLSVRCFSDSQINDLINKVFDKKFRDYITYLTGFKYSIDYLIFYDRRHIEEEFRNVSTLKQAYSYIWHFDKPNSSNMLKIIIPINISENHGPLKIFDKYFSKKNKLLKPIRNDKNAFQLLGKSKEIYGFNPTLCIHKDGIPDKNLVASQVMFQLNPCRTWSINSSISKRVPQLRNKIRIWNDEPKFPLFAYRSDRRISFSDY